MEKKYKATKDYWNNAMDGFSGIGEENHIKLKNGKAVWEECGGKGATVMPSQY